MHSIYRNVDGVFFAMSRPRVRISTAGILLALVAALIAAGLSGCSARNLPEGSQLQSSTFGLKFAPQAPDGAPLILGSHSLIITTAQPPDAGPNLNRFEGRAPGVQLRSTVATGAVGEQLEAAGGAEAIESLLRDRTSNSPTAAARDTVLGVGRSTLPTDALIEP